MSSGSRKISHKCYTIAEEGNGTESRAKVGYPVLPDLFSFANRFTHTLNFSGIDPHFNANCQHDRVRGRCFQRPRTMTEDEHVSITRLLFLSNLDSLSLHYSVHTEKIDVIPPSILLNIQLCYTTYSANGQTIPQCNISYSISLVTHIHVSKVINIRMRGELQDNMI